MGLKNLQQKLMVNGLPQFKTPLRLCKNYLVGKQHWDSFPKRMSCGEKVKQKKCRFFLKIVFIILLLSYFYYFVIKFFTIF